MDLFIMKRYEGDDGKKELTNQVDLLVSLLTKIEKRKKARENTIEDDVTKRISLEENESISVETKPTEKEKKKKHKKRKFESGNNEVATLMETSNETLNIAEEPIRKKRKKKLGDLHDTLKLNENEDSKHEEIKSKIPNKTPAGFTVIGTEKFSKISKVKRVLPYWLSQPFVISGSMKELSKTIYDIPGLDKDLVKRLEENEISHFFPVQSEVIPWLLEAHRRPLQYRPNDICVSAPTGSGKTLAFVLPVIQALKSRVMRHIRALVVLPVQDLALQIYDVFTEYCKGTDLKVILLTGQRSFVSEQQELVKTSSIIGQYNAVDIVVTTAGRLVEHLTGTSGFSLKYLRFLIIDEADRLVDNIQNEWLYHLEKHIYGEKKGTQSSVSCLSLQSMIPPPPQKLLYSATLTQDPEKLERIGLFQPKLFTTIVGEKRVEEENNVPMEVRGDFIGKYTTPAELIEKFCIADEQLKPLVLFHLINKENWKNVLCFTNSQQNTHRLAVLLKHLSGGSLKVGEISGAFKRTIRDKKIHKFSSGKLKVLVSTDALARGIDIPNVDCVVSYDVPQYVKTLIHRIGRTARAGKMGTAVTLLVNNQVQKFKQMLETAGKKESTEELVVAESDLEYLENDYLSALTALKKSLQEEEAQAHKKTNILKSFRPKSVLKKSLQKKKAPASKKANNSKNLHPKLMNRKKKHTKKLRKHKSPLSNK